MMRKELERRGMSFVSQHPTRSGYIIDFVFPDKKIGIECDGEQWHPTGNTRDRFRDWMLSRGGWKILRFRETKIKYSISECVDKVEKHIE
jgi:very-short-patch-repair endonuclease